MSGELAAPCVAGRYTAHRCTPRTARRRTAPPRPHVPYTQRPSPRPRQTGCAPASPACSGAAQRISGTSSYCKVTKFTCRLFENVQLNNKFVYYYCRKTKQRICQLLPKIYVHMSSVNFCTADIVKSCYNINRRDAIQSKHTLHVSSQPQCALLTYTRHTC